jgi:uncharacterized protein with gpF-like domain
MDKSAKRRLAEVAAKANAARNIERCLQLGITHYRLRVSIPERADPRCVQNDGETFAYALPPDQGFPGQGLCRPVDGYCRCTASPVISGFDE